MDGHTPLRLHLDPAAVPYAIYRTRPVPIHYQAEVKAGLERDVALGVVRRVDMGELATWCAPIHNTSKKNRMAWQTLDFQGLNAARQCQAHFVEAPFHQCMAVPHDKLKTTLDTWNSYHSVLLAKEDQMMTAFLTPLGRFCYRSAPQGF
jgi:hypothetical protein